MKKRLIRKMVIGLMLSFSMLEVAFAKDSFSIPVSCGIPAVPGLNVPLVEIAQEPAPAKAKQSEEQDINKNKNPDTVEEDTQKETLLVSGENLSLNVKTIYSR